MIPLHRGAADPTGPAAPARPGPVLVLDAGPSSLDYRLVEPDGHTVLRGTVDHVDETGWRAAIGAVRDDLDDHGVRREDLRAVGHRVPTDGRVAAPTVVDGAVLRELFRLAPTAPPDHHAALAALRTTRAALPDLPQVAVFDAARSAAAPDADELTLTRTLLALLA